jgi:iduronate 2-sulfatase
MLRVCSFLLVLCCAASCAAADRPNILLICVDDLKPTIGAYGDQHAVTPNLDALAKRGLLFERAYCNQAVCAPSRNALLTGLRPSTLGIYDLATNFRIARPNAVTMPQYFKEQGYHTQALGKIFHVGHGNVDDKASWSTEPFKTKVVSYLPQPGETAAPLTKEEALFSNQPAKGLPRGAPFTKHDAPDNKYADGIMAEEVATRLATRASKPNEPFFLAAGFVRPHLPFTAPKKYWDLYDPAKLPQPKLTKPPTDAPAYAATNWGELRQYEGMPENGPLTMAQQRELIHGYYASTSYMDAQLGKIIAALDKHDLAKNTIIVLWGDHGWHLGDHGQWCKHTNYEQAAHIPLIIVAPGITQAASRTKSLAESVNIYPTLVELAGLPARTDLDAKSIVPVLKNPAAATADSILHVYPRNNKLGRALRTARYRLVEWKNIGDTADKAEYELYDYEADPDETKNLAAAQPEVVKQLTKQLYDTYPEAKPQVKK